VLGLNNFRNLSTITRGLRSRLSNSATKPPRNPIRWSPVLDSLDRTAEASSASLPGLKPTGVTPVALRVPARDAIGTPVRIRTNPSFNGTMGTTSTEANPEVETAIKVAVEKALEAKIAGTIDIQVVLTSTLADVDPTSERAIYNHYGFVAVTATGKTSDGAGISLNGEYYVSSGELSMVEIALGSDVVD